MFNTANKRLLTLIYRKVPQCLVLKRIVNNVSITSQRNHFFKLSPKDRVVGSRYVPPSREEQAVESITSTLRNKNFLSEQEWDDFKSNLIDSKDCVSEDTFGVIVMDALLSLNQLDLGHSFLNYLEHNTVKPNSLIYLKYISLCSKNHTIVDQNLVLRLLDKVKAQIDGSLVLDKKRAEYFIQGLCVTDRWEESLKYINKLIDSKPTREICNALACAAIRNGNEVLSWEILMKWMNYYEAVSDKVIEEFLLVSLKMQKSSALNSELFLLKLFKYMQTRNVIVSLNVAKLIEQYFKSHHLKWSITYTKVSRKGICATCQRCLELPYFDNDEFKALCNSFLEKAVKKSDLFINTNSNEFKNYMEFINFHKPFNIVLDGLNAAYSFPGAHNRKNLASQLLRIVQMLSGKSRNLLVLGRKHMQYWPKFELMKISNKAKLFFMDNISQDDPFVIYAALASGPHTLFLSDDLMRDHLSRLGDPKLIHLFKKWQLSHQISLQCDENKEIKFIEPVRHDIAVQGNSKYGWHIPFDDKIILDPYEELNNWLCIKRIE